MLITIKELTEEYIAKEGYISAELSASQEELTIHFLDVIEKMNQELSKMNAKWIIFYCNVCKYRNADKPLHLEIIRNESFNYQAVYRI